MTKTAEYTISAAAFAELVAETAPIWTDLGLSLSTLIKDWYGFDVEFCGMFEDVTYIHISNGQVFSLRNE